MRLKRALDAVPLLASIVRKWPDGSVAASRGRTETGIAYPWPFLLIAALRLTTPYAFRSAHIPRDRRFRFARTRFLTGTIAAFVAVLTLLPFASASVPAVRAATEASAFS